MGGERSPASTPAVSPSLTPAPEPARRSSIDPGRDGTPATDVERELEELIAALDRRVPRVERAGEAAIAEDAAALREKAVRRLAELSEPRAITADDRSDPST